MTTCRHIRRLLILLTTILTIVISFPLTISAAAKKHIATIKYYDQNGKLTSTRSYKYDKYGYQTSESIKQLKYPSNNKYYTIKSTTTNIYQKNHKLKKTITKGSGVKDICYYNSKGFPTKDECSVDGILWVTTYSYKNGILSKVTSKQDGKIDFIEKYDSKGRLKEKEKYIYKGYNTVTKSIISYSYTFYSNGKIHIKTELSDDYTITSIYDKNENLLQETEYFPDKSGMASMYQSTYKYSFKNGLKSQVKCYRDGKLISTTKYTYTTKKYSFSNFWI